MLESQKLRYDFSQCVTLASVKHSQSSSLPPLKVWLLAERNGVIVCGHCTCMAGLGETCSHVGALVFLIEYSVKKLSGVACTDEINKWLPPTVRSVPFNRVLDMDVRSSAARLTAFLDDDGPATVSRDTFCEMVSAPSKETNKLFLARLSELYPTSAVLSAHLDYCQPFEPPELVNLPKDLSTLWDPSASEVSFEELLDICRNLILDIGVTADEIKRCEEATRKQSSNELWFTLRAGRITASNMKKVCVGDVRQPAISTINSICYKGKEINTAPVLRGKKLEPVARRRIFVIA